MGIQKRKLGSTTDQNEQFSDQKICKEGKIDEKLTQKAYLSTQKMK